MNRRVFLGASIGAVSLSGSALGYAKFIEPNHVAFTTHRLPARDSLGSFALISDVHLRGLSAGHERIAAEIRRRNPDYLLFTGDSVDRPDELGLLDALLGDLPPVPKFAIMGNWEHWGGVSAEDLSRTFERHNGRVLVNEWVLHAGVLIVGLDDLVGGRPDLGRALTGAPEGGPRLLLAHCPAQRDSLGGVGDTFGLMLSGHTHGGQIRVFGQPVALPPGSGRYVSGWYRSGGPAMYVSRGVGTSVLPLRFACRPEVAFFSA